jgi:hypothetical protein
MWNTKKPPSHSSSKTNPSPRNIVRLFLQFDCLMHFGSEILSTTLQAIGDVAASGGSCGWGSVCSTAGRPVLRKVRCPRLEKRCLRRQIKRVATVLPEIKFPQLREQWIVRVKADRRRPNRRAAPPPRGQRSRAAHVRLRFQPGLQSFASFYPDPAAIALDS